MNDQEQRNVASRTTDQISVPNVTNAASKPTPRVAFISASYLARQWEFIPQSILTNSLFIFGSKRHWLFPETENDHRDAACQPTQYDTFKKKFLNLVREKENRGEVIFLKPPETLYAGDWVAVSDWLTGIIDPVTGGCYAPLLLSADWWRRNHGKSVHGSNTKRVIINFQSGDHGYEETLELLHHSNPSMIPCLSWEPGLLSDWQTRPPVHSIVSRSSNELETGLSSRIGKPKDFTVPITNNTLWPLEKLLTRATKLAKSGHMAASESTAVLLLTGALNPVHVGHLQSLEYARDALEESGITVLGGFLSPSHDSYVKPKMARGKERWWDATRRTEACDAAVYNSQWLHVGRWESLGAHERWPDYPEVCTSLGNALRRSGPDLLEAMGRDQRGMLPTVYYVCGWDHYQKCGLEGGMGLFGLCVLPRDDFGASAAARVASEARMRNVTNPNKKIIGCIKAPGALSSTLIRKRIHAREEILDGWLPAGVLEILSP